MQVWDISRVYKSFIRPDILEDIIIMDYYEGQVLLQCIMSGPSSLKSNLKFNNIHKKTPGKQLV